VIVVTLVFASTSFKIPTKGAPVPAIPCLSIWLAKASPPRASSQSANATEASCRRALPTTNESCHVLVISFACAKVSPVSLPTVSTPRYSPSRRLPRYDGISSSSVPMGQRVAWFMIKPTEAAIRRMAAATSVETR